MAETILDPLYASIVANPACASWFFPSYENRWRQSIPEMETTSRVCVAYPIVYRLRGRTDLFFPADRADWQAWFRKPKPKELDWSTTLVSSPPSGVVFFVGDVANWTTEVGGWNLDVSGCNFDVVVDVPVSAPPRKLRKEPEGLPIDIIEQSLAAFAAQKGIDLAELLKSGANQLKRGNLEPRQDALTDKELTELILDDEQQSTDKLS